MALVEKLQNLAFLGQEFATWLYWKADTQSNKLALGGAEFELWFESPVQLVCDFGEATVVVLKGGTPLDSPEAHQAFREDKKVSRTRLRCNLKNQTYTFGLDADTGRISGLKLPVPPEAAAADYLFLRLELLEEFETFWNGVFEAFLETRMDDDAWKKERGQIKKWVSSKATAGD